MLIYGKYPASVNGNLPAIQDAVIAHYCEMPDRKSEIARIKKRMDERNFNERSLSMKLFNTPDRVRDFFRGKSQNPRSDTYIAIINELFPEEKKDNFFSPLDEELMGQCADFIEIVCKSHGLNLSYQEFSSYVTKLYNHIVDFNRKGKPAVPNEENAFFILKKLINQ